MTVRVGVNGFGRIGRNFWRAVDAQNRAGTADVEIVAVNDITDNATLAHLLKYDSILGRLPHDVSSTDEEIVVDGKGFKGLAVRDPAELPWKDLGVDVVVESTGLFTKRDAAAKHLDAGAKKVVISAPATGEDLTVVKGVNDDAYDGSQTVVSNASCTTNCLAPLAKVLDDLLRDREGSDDHDPRLHPGPEPAGRPAQGPAPRPGRRPQHRARRRPAPRRRSAWSCRTSRASSTATRCASRSRPARRPTSPSRSAARRRSKRSTRRTGRRRPTAASRACSPTPTPRSSPPTSSTDPASCIYDSGLTKVIGNQVKVVGWYDNEWGYSNRLVDIVALVASKL